MLLIHYGEIGLKGKNRRFFIDKLINNLVIKTKIGKKQFRLVNQSIFCQLSKDYFSEKKLISKLQQVFGISWFAFVYLCQPNLSSIKKLVESMAVKKIIKEPFAVRVTRIDKNFGKNSVELEKILGQLIVDKIGAKVNLVTPETTLYVRISFDKVSVFFKKHSGLGGLPTGCSGKALALFSGGIDSPIAVWLAAKRGLEVNLLHFSAISPQMVKKTKIMSIFKKLKQFLPRCRLQIIPYVHFQLKLLDLDRRFKGYEVLIFRRFMLKAAQSLTDKPIILGDSLSQVASQTLENLQVTDFDLDNFILRPLIAYDKQEIIDLAKKIGIYNLAIRPYKDCCSLLHKKPATCGNLKKLLAAEKHLPIKKLIEMSLKDSLVIT